ncbi:MAG: ABC transporter substrate-binding protein [Alphaproteobacteria bacterium]|nr:ABC transporter substrate-binding protein [Alphaproteobacteria bacterium]
MRALGQAFAGVLIAAGLSVAAAAQPVVVASKVDSEGALLGNLIAITLEAHGIAVTRRIQLGPTEIVRKAILAGQIDIYPEYTGNGALFFRLERDAVWRDPGAGYARVKALDRERNDLVWLTPAPADNTWEIAVRRDLASGNHLASLADFARYVTGRGEVKLAASSEFVNSPNALPAFEKAYGFTLRRRQMLVLAGGDTAATLRAAADGTDGVNAAMAYGTDGALATLGLVTLTDDKHVQVVYRPAPVVRGTVLDRHPPMPAFLEPVFAALSLVTLRELNAKIAVEGFDAKTVASEFLRAHRLLK